uniref:BPTI/Kunitz inhibitor domain-containing protein n=1 Tax=Lygus hesperus TaxID=30085 RepID=A0A0K8TK00_LYGHE
MVAGNLFEFAAISAILIALPLATTAVNEICRLPVPNDYIECNAYFPSYRFNASSKQCDRFVYGGCGGNANRFRTKGECERTCAEARRLNSVCPADSTWNAQTESCVCSPELCPKESCAPDENMEVGVEATGWPGDCCARYICRSKSAKKYNPYWKDTVAAILKKSRATRKNQFDVEEAGAHQVDRFLPEICLLPQAPGLCKAAFRRYYFDASSQQCVLFTYGGCMGNGNNFQTKEECEQTCAHNTDSSDESSGEEWYG